MGTTRGASRRGRRSELTPETIRVVIVTAHVAGCSAVRSWPDNPWAYFVDGAAEYRGSDGRKIDHGHGRFIRLKCNSTTCPGAALVAEADLTELVQRAVTASAARSPRATKKRSARAPRATKKTS